MSSRDRIRSDKYIAGPEDPESTSLGFPGPASGSRALRQNDIDVSPLFHAPLSPSEIPFALKRIPEHANAADMGFDNYELSPMNQTSDLDPGSNTDDLFEMQQLAQAASDKIPLLDHAQLSSLKSQLEGVLEEVEQKLQEPFKPNSRQQLPTPMASNSSVASVPVEEFRCPLCFTDEKTYKKFFLFKRHLQERHGIQASEYHCIEPGCPVTIPQLGKMKEHLRKVHDQQSTTQQLKEHRVRLPCPSICEFCFKSTESWTWGTFYRHVKEHCIVLPPQNSFPRGHTAGVTIPEGQSRRSQKRKRNDEEKSTLSRVPKTCTRCGHDLEQCWMCCHQLESVQSCHRCNDPFEQTARAAQPAYSLLEGYFFGSSDMTQNTALGQPFTIGGADFIGSHPSQGSASSAASYVATNITSPDLNDDSIDAGIPDTKNMDHILDAARYFKELDQLELQTAQILGMKNGPYTKLDSLHDCLGCLRNLEASLRYLHSEGVCGSTISILTEDQNREGVASAVHISLSQIHPFISLFQDIRDPLNEEAIMQLTKDWMQTLLNVQPQSFSNFNWVEMLPYLCKILALGFISFSGSHVCRFDINLWDQEMTEIPIGYDCYAFRLQKLACLDDFIGGPVWVLGKTCAPPRGLKISFTVQDLQELWGPVSLLGGTADEAPVLQTERGFIVPLPKELQSSSSTHTSQDEIECHWTTESPPEFSEEGDDLVFIPPTSRILIGTSNDFMTELVVNHKCKSSISLIGQQIACRLQYPGTCNSRYVSDGYDVQLVGGQYVTAGLIKKYKRMPKRTLKSMLIADCTKPDTRLLPLLDCRVGLEVSVCTGNAQRVTLWDALRFSQTSTQSTTDSLACTHAVGDKNCISRCWTRLWPTDELDSFDNVFNQNKILSGADARRIIINSILGLEHSGIDGEGNLQVYWPFNNSPANYSIPPSTPKASHNWFRVVRDTRDTSSFAVFTQRCLEFSEKGLVRSCSAPCKTEDPKALQTILSTRVLAVSEQPVFQLLQGDKFLIGDAHLTATKAMQNQFAVIAAVSINPLNSLRYRLREILPDSRVFDCKEHIWPDISSFLSVPVFVY